MTGSCWSAPFIWNPEQIDRLTELYVDQGLTGMEVAEIMGITRNRVMGKLHRLGLLGNRGPSNQFSCRVVLKAPRPPRAAPAPKKERAKRSLVPPTTAPPLPPLPEPRASLWEGLAGEIDGLKPGECRYPLGEPLKPSTSFCRAHTGDRKQTYCEYHRFLTTKRPNAPKEWYEDDGRKVWRLAWQS